MYYSRWSTKEEVDKITETLDPKSQLEQSGIPLGYDKNKLNILKNSFHTVVFGSMGSGKTQTITLPLIRLSINAGESFVVNDPKGELYEKTANKLESEGYSITILDIDKPKYGDNFNPLTLPYYLYKNGEKDKATELVEEIGHYLIYDKKNVDSDPFWDNSTANLFTGLVLYLFEHAKENEINLNSVLELTNLFNKKEGSKEFLEKIDKNSTMYKYLMGTLLAPPETKGSILSVFYQKINLFTSKEYLSEMLSKTSFDIKNIGNTKQAIFIKSGIASVSDYIIPMLITEIYTAIDIYANQKKRVNIILDDFDNINPINNFTKIITSSRSMNLSFTVMVSGETNFIKKYGKEETEIMKFCFQNFIYLLSEDINTLNDICSMCGKKNEKEDLISIEELKSLETFEAIAIIIRTMPIRVKLLPDYKIDWGYTDKEKTIKERKLEEIKIYSR